jgi:N-carbamoyl-L-amino-acid hydrolase
VIFTELWAQIAPIGRDDKGGYLRYALGEPELILRDWFRNQADERDLEVTDDGNGNLFAWWGDPWGHGAVLTGSHFDSVPHGGGYDGPLGIVSAFLAIDRLRERGVAPARPIAVAAFVEEEGGRFGVPCLGSRLLTGAIDPDRAAELCDRDGISFGSPRPSSCTSSRAARSTSRSGWRARSGRTAAGGSTSPATATTPAPPGWPTGTTRC